MFKIARRRPGTSGDEPKSQRGGFDLSLPSGFATYVWITPPSGKRQRKYVYGRTREVVHGRWVELTRKPRAGRSLPRCRRLGSSSIDGSKMRLLRILPPLRTRHMRAT